MIEWSEILTVIGELGIDFTDIWTEADLARARKFNARFN
jgi:hypothetical protein